MKCADILAHAATLNFKKQSYLFEPWSVHVSSHWLHRVSLLLAILSQSKQSGIEALLGNGAHDSRVD